MLEVSVESIRRYDWFRIFYLTEEKEEQSLIKIFPEYELIPMEITRRVREFQADDTEYAQDRKGDDASETYQIRSYREQDNIKADGKRGKADDPGKRISPGLRCADLD